MRQRFVVVDLETTGNSPQKGDKIIQFAAVVIEDGEIIERFTTFINPKREIPIFIEQLTGISGEVVANAPEFSLVAPDIIELFNDSYFVAHNVPFDYSFLMEELARAGFEAFHCYTIDTVELSRIMLPFADGYKLSELAERFSLQHDNPHQADSDAEVTAEILRKILEKVEKLPLTTIRRLYSLSKGYKSDLFFILQDMIEQREKLTQEGNFDVYRGLALKKQDTNSIKYTSKDMDMDYDKVLNAFSFRKGQVEMSSFIMNAFQMNQHALVEAGTGSGKSLAYLIPSSYFSKKNGRVLISTYTVQLQQQLLEKDIPYLRKRLPYLLEVAVLKGKKHYLSLRKFEQSLYDETDNYDEILTKSQILIWLTETQTGDIDEISLPSGGQRFWNQICMSEADLLIDECPWESRCFYRNARQKADEADIIITNHALLFSDVRSEKNLLPSYDYLIVDEAHHIEAIARRQLGMQLNYIQLLSTLSLLGSLDSHGLLSKSVKVFKAIGAEKAPFQVLDRLMQHIKSTCNSLFRLLRSHVLLKSKNHKQDNIRIQYLVTPDQESGELWKEIIELTSSLLIHNKELYTLSLKQRELFSKFESMTTSTQGGLIGDFFANLDIVIEYLQKLGLLLLKSHSDITIWVETDQKGPLNAATIYGEPVDIADFLADKLFLTKKSVVLTSATLTVDDSFQYSIKKNGLEDFQPLTLSVPSPFDFRKQTAVMIPTDIPVIHSVSMEEFIRTISAQIAKIAKKTSGRMLVLFNSYEMLRKVFNELKECNSSEDFLLIAQGISGGSRTKLTKSFQANNKAILLGTSSFWEGVDIPGEDLSALVIVRLPFSPPSDPFVFSRQQQIEQEGGDSFQELSLPEAIIKFRQGIGRLIRTEEDRGVIFIMDRRIISAGYGKKFLSSLPQTTILREPIDSLLEKIDDWVK